MYEREVVIIRSANVETLGESVFPARNAIDGVTEYSCVKNPRQFSAPFYIRTLLQTDSDCEFQETFLPDIWQ